VPAGDRRGFVIVQIDGLAYDYLSVALSLGYAPHLRRLLERSEMRMHAWMPGVPATTPASQAGIMFGDSSGIPAFRWYDKPGGRAMVCSQPSVAQAIQERLAAQATGLLRGGSSYMNLFDGGAELAVFTLGGIGRRRFFEGLRGIGFLALFALNPLRTGRVAILSVWEYLTDLAQRLEAEIRNTVPRPIAGGFTFLRVMSNVVLREIQSFSVLLDIVRGVPSLYTTYYGYDELAHHFGPLSKPALRALRSIDKQIHTIDRYRRMNLRRPYDLYVISDHGMTEGTPFAREYGETLGQLVQDLVGRSVAISELYGSHRGDTMTRFFVQQELEAIEQSIKPPLSRVPHYLSRYVEDRIASDAALPEAEGTGTADVVVSSSGSLSHVYLNARPEQMSLTEIIALYPTLVSSLVSHPGIWLVVSRDGGRAAIVGADGSVSVGEDGVRVDGQNPLRDLPYGDWAIRQLARLATMENAGDLILLGRYDADRKHVSCFEAQWACHGGLGGPQDMAVLLTEPHIAWQDTPIDHATVIYRLFTRHYGIV
jgi:hypothetical protein